MFDILFEDISAEIVSYCDMLTLGKLSLTFKGAAPRTWSLPSKLILDVWKYPKENVYNDIVRFTGSRLTSFSLRSQDELEDAKIIQHVLDHCINLRSLKISMSAFNSDRIDDQCWSRLFSRLTTLKVDFPEHRHVLRFVHIIQATLNMKLETLHTSIMFDSDLITTGVREMINHLAPTLKDFECRATVSTHHLQSIFSCCTKLERLTVGFCAPDGSEPWESFHVDCFRALASTKVGFNFFEKIESSSVSFLFLWIVHDEMAIESILEQLQTVGLKQQIPPLILAEILRLPYVTETLLDLIESGKNPLLPPARSLAATPIEWGRVMAGGSATRWDRLVRLFGTPPASAVEDLKTDDMVRWFVRHVDRDQIISLFNRMPTPGRTLLISKLMRAGLLDVLANELQNNSFLSLDDDQLVYFVAGFSSLSLDTLRLFVDATRWGNIGPSARGAVFWTLLERALASEESFNALYYWVRLIQSDISTTEPALFQENLQRCLRALVSVGSSTNFRGLQFALTSLKDLLIRQCAAHLQDLTSQYDFLSAIRSCLLWYATKNPVDGSMMELYRTMAHAYNSRAVVEGMELLPLLSNLDGSNNA